MGGTSGTQTLTVQGLPSINSDLALSTATGSDIQAHGVLELDSPASGGYAELTGGSGITLVNDGTFETLDATSQPDYIEANLTNDSGGTVTISGAMTHQDQGTTTVNNGAVTVTAAGDLAVSSGSAFTDSAGTLVDSGAMSLNDSTFTQSGGAESGGTVALSNGSTLADSAGGGAFSFENTDTLSGTIPSGQTVTVLGAPSVNTTAALASPGVTNDGTFVLDSQASGGYAQVDGSPLTNNGTFETLDATSQPDYIEVNLTNNTGATVTISGAITDQNQGTTTTNHGKFTVSSTGDLAVASGLRRSPTAPGPWSTKGPCRSTTAPSPRPGGWSRGARWPSPTDPPSRTAPAGVRSASRTPTP